MLYINNSKLTDKLIAKSISITFEDVQDIAYGLPTSATATTSQLETILEVLLYTSLTAQRFVSTVYDYTSNPPIINLPEIWFDKVAPSPTATKYCNNYAHKQSKIIICNLLSFLEIVPEINRLDLTTVFPNNNGLFTHNVATSGTNENIINSLMQLSAPDKPSVLGNIAISELYNVIIGLLNILSPANNYTSFQISTLGIPAINTKAQAIAALETLILQEEGGANNPYDISVVEYLMHYKLGEIINEQKYVLVTSNVYDYAGSSLSFTNFDKDENLNTTSLNSNATFLAAIANITSMQDDVYTSIENAYLYENINYFNDAMDLETDIYNSLETLRVNTISWLSLTNDFFIPFYSFL